MSTILDALKVKNYTAKRILIKKAVSEETNEVKKAILNDALECEDINSQNELLIYLFNVEAEVKAIAEAEAVIEDVEDEVTATAVEDVEDEAEAAYEETETETEDVEITADEVTETEVTSASVPKVTEVKTKIVDKDSCLHRRVVELVFDFVHLKDVKREFPSRPHIDQMVSYVKQIIMTKKTSVIYSPLIKKFLKDKAKFHEKTNALIKEEKKRKIRNTHKSYTEEEDIFSIAFSSFPFSDEQIKAYQLAYPRKPDGIKSRNNKIKKLEECKQSGGDAEKCILALKCRKRLWELINKPDIIEKGKEIFHKLTGKKLSEEMNGKKQANLFDL